MIHTAVLKKEVSEYLNPSKMKILLIARWAKEGTQKIS